jgi:hypothetical protein
MAVTSQQIIDFLLANPGMSDAQIVAAMEQYGVSPAQMATAVGLPEGEVVSRVAATIPEGMSVTLGDTRIAPQYEVRGSGEDRQVGGIENITVEKTTGDINYKPPVGAEFQNYSPTGEFIGTGKVTSSGDQSFFGGLVDAFKDPVVLAALGGAAAGGLFGGAGALGGAGTTGLTLAELGGTAGAGALTAAESAALYGTGASALGTAGVIGSDLAGLSGIPAGTGALTAAESAALYGTGGAAGTGLLTTGGANTVAGAGAGASSTLSGLTGGSSLSGLTGGSSLSGLTTAGGLAGANTLLGGTALGSTLGALTTGVAGSTLGSTLGSTIGSTLGSTLANTAASTLTNRLTSGNLSNLFSGGLGTAGSLLQMQQSKEAAQRAQAMIDAETAAAKASAAFRPVGMTTRFGTSQFAVDPVTGQLTSAGYTLSPEAKNAQDRLVKLAESGLQQAEGAQAQFAPLQTGAQTLFGLGNQYLAQNPQDVAQNYLNQQMALLQPGRELELANLQNRLQQQGRGGLSVAQGGTLGATTPELQALFNARAQQEAQLAANAQQAGQQQVAFGAGLLGTGAQTMGQYYGGQQAAYAPYTTALGQVQGLEQLAQQPLQMGATLGQQSSAAGARMGELGLRGAGQSVALATGADATRNLGAQSLIAAGNPNAMFGQAIGGLLGGGLQSAFSGTGLGSSGFGTGLAYGNQDLGLFL